LWDATFHTGSWSDNLLDLYGRDFAELATNATQLLILSVTPEFVAWDGDASSTKGCSYNNACTPITPSEISALSNRILYYSVELGDPYPSVLDGQINQTTDYTHDTYVQWSQSQVSAVPVPAAVWFFSPVILGFLSLRRKLKLG
jgi:hypothetical protein